MSDDQTLVKRLREVGGMSDDGATRWYINPDGPEAADRIEKLEAALREMLEKCTWAKREKWCGSLDCHCQIARKALEGKDV